MPGSKGGPKEDATFITAPATTKKAKRAHDPERHQTKKGNPGYFGLKAPMGTDRDNNRVHT